MRSNRLGVGPMTTENRSTSRRTADPPNLNGGDTSPDALRAALNRAVEERAQIESSLEQERHFLHTLLERMPDNIYFKDRDGAFLRLNPPLARFFGAKDPAEIVGRTDADFYPAEEARRFRADELAVMETGDPLVAKVERCVDSRGRVRWYSTSKAPLLDEDGNITGVVGISRDITELRRMASFQSGQSTT